MCITLLDLLSRVLLPVYNEQQNMKVHFTCSTNEFEKYFELYKLIRKTIRTDGHILTRDWLYEELEHRKKGVKRYSNEVYYKTLQAILDADVVVIEGTVPSFHIGHQITIALQKNKPVLFLSLKPERGKWPTVGLFRKEEKRPLLYIKKYTRRSLKTILERFFQEYKKGPMTRFNLILEHDIENYLRWASLTYKKSKSDIIRNLLRQYMGQEDGKYQEYLEEKE